MATATVSKDFLKALGAAEATEPSEYERWDPEENPIIAGVVKEIKVIDTNFGDATVVTLKDEGPDRLGLVEFIANTVLKNQIEKLEIKKGSVIGIKYFGEAISKAGNTYKNFKVMVQGEAEADEDPFEDE